MRGKKKKGTIIKPSTSDAMAAAMLQKLKHSAPGLNLPEKPPESASLNQSEYTYFSETTNEDTVGQRKYSESDAPNDSVNVDIKDITFEATLEEMKEKQNKLPHSARDNEVDAEHIRN